MRKQKGFTLVELVIVIIIVGILSIVAVPIYRGYTRKAMTTEGKALLGAIQMAERAYFTENASYFGTDEISFCEELDIDARSNKYFTSFWMVANNESTDKTCLIGTEGIDGATGIELNLLVKANDASTFFEKGVNDDKTLER